MLIIDSNIWTYCLDADAREHSFVVTKVEDAISKEKIVINPVMLIEVAHFLIKNLGPVIGSEKLKVFFDFPFIIIGLNYDITLRSIELLKYSDDGIGGRDATILATAEPISVKKLMTHDNTFKRIDWLEAIDLVYKRVHELRSNFPLNLLLSHN
jgi:predicted nucleic acid-binding protein